MQWRYLVGYPTKWQKMDKIGRILVGFLTSSRTRSDKQSDFDFCESDFAKFGRIFHLITFLELNF